MGEHFKKAAKSAAGVLMSAIFAVTLVPFAPGTAHAQQWETNAHLQALNKAEGEEEQGGGEQTEQQPENEEEPAPPQEPETETPEVPENPDDTDEDATQENNLQAVMNDITAVLDLGNFVPENGASLNGEDLSAQQGLMLEIQNALIEGGFLQGVEEGEKEYDIHIFDFTVKDNADESLDLDGENVTVCLQNAAAGFENDAFTVYYADFGGENEDEVKLDAVETTAEGKDVFFVTNHFSVYVLVRTGEARQNVSLAPVNTGESVSIVGQVDWNTEKEGVWEKLIRPAYTAAGAKAFKFTLVSCAADGAEIEEYEMQSTDSEDENYIEWQFTTDVRVITYNIKKFVLPAGHHNFKVKLKAPYYKESVVEYPANTAGVVDFGEVIILEPDFVKLDVYKEVIPAYTDGSDFAVEVTAKKSAEDKDSVVLKGTAAAPASAGADGKTAGFDIPRGFYYELKEKDPGNYQPAYDGKEKGTLAEETTETKITNAKFGGKLAVTKVWNDNNDATDRPKSVADWLNNVVPAYSLDNGITWNVFDDTAAVNDLGLTSAPVITSADVEERTLSEWDVVLEQKFPSFSKEGTPVIYSIIENAGNGETGYKGYAISRSADGTKMYNTKETTFKGEIHWYDEAVASQRPQTVTITLYRYKNNESSKAEEVGTYTVNAPADGDLNKWFINIPGLPMYAEAYNDGEEKPYGDYYTYFVKQEELAGEYRTAYDNLTGPEGSITSELYGDGIIRNTYYTTTEFSANKKWIDNNGNATTRPKATLYLYRYPVVSDKDEDNIKAAAPVTYRDSEGNNRIVHQKLALDEGDYEFTFPAKDDKYELAAYDEFGREYVYFVKEIFDEDPGEYTRRYFNAENGGLYESIHGTKQGGTVFNAQYDTIDYDVSKKWVSGSYQDIAKGLKVYLNVQRRPKGEDDSAWEYVEEYSWNNTDANYGNAIEVKGFSAEETERVVIAALQNYVLSGGKPYENKYEYRVTEAAVVDANGKNLLQPNGTILVAGKTYKYSYEGREGYYDTESNPAVYVNPRLTAVNTLFGQVDIKINKTWKPSAPEDAKIWIKVNRKTKTGDNEKVLINPGGEDEYLLEMNSTTGWSIDIKNLDRYDADGYEYLYTIEEAGMSADGEWSNYITYSNKEENGVAVKTANVYNTAGGTGEHHYWAEKQWVDDDDIEYREPVKLRIYEKINDEYVVVNKDDGEPYEITLSKESNWRNYFSFEQALTNPVIREYSVVGNAACGDETCSLPHDGKVSYEDFDNGIGTLVTENQLYNVTHKENGKTTVITNQRYGTINVEVEKTWKDGGETDKRFDVSFDLYKGKDIIDTITLTKANATDEDAHVWQGVFEDLEKYDASGALIQYTVKERFPESAENSPYIAEIDRGEYIVGAHHTNDTMGIKVINTREGTTEYTVHKAWQDPANKDRRPDIYVELYYSIKGEKDDESGQPVINKYSDLEGKKDDPDYPDYDSVWVGLLEYVWNDAPENSGYDSDCTVKGLNAYTVGKYDEDGKETYEPGREIVYYSREQMNGGDEYSVFYGNSLDNLAEDKDPKDEDDEIAPLYAGHKEYIANRLQSRVEIKGIKLWQNLQSKTIISELPNPAIKLYRSTLPFVSEESFASAQLVATTYLDKEHTGFNFISEQPSLDPNGNATDAKIPVLEKYDENGELYYYAVKEDFAGGKLSNVYTGGRSVFQLTNTYVTDEGNQRELSLGKTWENVDAASTGIAAESVKYPVLKFDIYRAEMSDKALADAKKTLEEQGGTPTDAEIWEKAWEDIWAEEELKNKLFRTDTFMPDKEDGYTVSENKSTFAFKGLYVWSEKGEQYQYAIREQSINGYTSIPYAAEGGTTSTYILSKDDLELVVFKDEKYTNIEAVKQADYFKASYKNSYSSTGQNITLEGTKIWQDNDDYAGIRPVFANEPPYTATTNLMLDVKRSTSSTLGAGNAITEHLVQGTDYVVNWTEDAENSNKWTYKITTKDGKGLMQYAPNGELYNYKVIEYTEKTEDEGVTKYSVAPYKPAPANGIVTVNGEAGKEDYSLKDLTNNLYTQYTVEKNWDDINNKYGMRPDGDDYLIVKLQWAIKPDGDAEPEDKDFNDIPYEAFENIEDVENWAEKYKEANDSAEVVAYKLFPAKGKANTFNKLPSVNSDGNEVVYRAVEHALVYKGKAENGEDLTLEFKGGGSAVAAGAYTGAHTHNAEHTKTTILNSMQQAEVKLVKTWDDFSNEYNTRPAAIKVQLLSQYKDTSPEKWLPFEDPKMLPLDAAANYPNITVAWDDENHATWKITGMPATDITGQKYEYKLEELTDGLHNYEEPKGENYIYANSTTTIKNILQSSEGIEDKRYNITAKKVWHGQNPAVTEATLLLQGYVGADNTEYFKEPKAVVLNGVKDSEEGNPNKELYYEKEAWQAVWENLPTINGDGDEIRYEVTEKAVDGFLPALVEAVPASEIEDEKIDFQFNVTNIKATSLDVTKNWINDARHSIFGNRPKNLEVTLERKVKDSGNFAAVTYAQLYEWTGAAANEDDWTAYWGAGKQPGMLNDTVVVSFSGEGDEWKHTIDMLPLYSRSGEGEYEYRAVELPLNGYKHSPALPDGTNTTDAETSLGKTTLTNTLITGGITAKKIWDDNGNNNGTRPAFVEVELYKKTAEDAEFKATGLKEKLEGGLWSATFANLPVYGADGEEIQYKVVEKDIPLYAAEYDSGAGIALTAGGADEIKITNTLTTGNLEVTKKWVGDEDHTGHRPTGGITVKLYAKGIGGGGADKLVDTVDITSANGWKHTFKNLPLATDDGTAITYYVEEDTVLHYQVSYSPAEVTLTKGDAVAAEITNSYHPQNLDVAVKKLWEDNGDKFGVRPSGVNVQLWVTIDKGEAGKLEGYFNGNGSTPAADPTAASKIELNTGNSWEDSWKALDVAYTDGGTTYPIAYSVKEEPVLGYIAEYSSAPIEEGIEITVTNRVNSGINISLEKKWEDGENAYNTRPEKIKFTLQQRPLGSTNNGDWETVSATGLINPVEINVPKTAAGLITHEFAGLPGYYKNGASVEACEYRVFETVPNGYTAAYSQTSFTESGKTVITNKLETVSIRAKKLWQGDGETTEKRLDEIEIGLYKGSDASPLQTATLNEEGGWQYEFANLPKFATGTLTHESYTVKETTTGLPAYYVYGGDTVVNGGTAAGADGFIEANVTNTLRPYTISGKKTWDDFDNIYNMRFDVELEVTASDKIEPLVEDEDYFIVWNKQTGNVNEWTYKIYGLSEKDAGGGFITYTIAEKLAATANYTLEDPVGGEHTFTAAANGAGENADFKNKLKTGTISIEKRFVEGGTTDDIFNFTIDFTSPATNEKIRYSGDYTVETRQSDGTWANPQTKQTDKDGMMTIGVGERLTTNGIAQTLEYEVTEHNTIHYSEDSKTGHTGTVQENNVLDVVYTNKPSTLLGIENTTQNPADKKATNIGGRVNVIIGEHAEFPQDPSEDLNRKDQVTVAWQPEMNWLHNDSMWITFKEQELDEEWQKIEINNFMDANGQVKPMSDPVFAALRQVYPHARMIYDESTETIALNLAPDAEEMKKSTVVFVSFAPTLAVENITAESYIGGRVQVEGGTSAENGDGLWNVDGKRPYKATTVSGTAESGYYVDLNSLTIGNLRLPVTPFMLRGWGIIGDNVSINPDENGRFTTTHTVVVAGVSEQVTVSGTVLVTEGTWEKPTAVSIVLDELPIPLEIGIPFAPLNNGDGNGNTGDGENSGGENSSTAAELGIPKTGDETPLGLVAGVGAAAFAGAAAVFAGKAGAKKRRRRKNER